MHINNLERLSLSFNFINELNGCLKVLKSLKFLDFSANKIEFLTNDEMEGMMSLTFLDLSKNPLKQIELNQLINLKNLKLSNVNSSSIISLNFSLFAQLEELDLSDNILSNKIDFEQLKNLKKLNLRNTNTTNCTFLKSLIYLNYLDTSENEKNDINLFLRYLSENIKFLIASKSRLAQIKPFGYTENVVHLDLGQNSLDEIILDIYSNLNYLDLSLNSFRDFKFLFHELFNLDYVNLNRSLSEELAMRPDSIFSFELNLKEAVLSNNFLLKFPTFCVIFEVNQLKSVCKLKKLYFDHNRLEKIDSIMMNDLQELVYLNLDSNRLSLIEEESFNNLKSLEFLILSNNNLIDLNGIFDGLTNIKILISKWKLYRDFGS
jgi:Leucine-rich repeat (LRR) protein